MNADITILVVEDNKKLASSLCELIQKQGYCVELEPRGDKAVYRILREKPDLVILDIMLPGMNGKQVCHTVRNDYAGKILMLTALNDIDDEVSSLNLGADDFVTKPVKSEVLMARVAALLRRPALSNAIDKLKFGCLTIDLLKQEVLLAQQHIELKPSEYELLALLANNYDTPLDRNSIMMALRGRTYDGVDRSIDLRISYLRKKLQDSVDSPYRIKTVRGKGYMLVSTAWENNE